MNGDSTQTQQPRTLSLPVVSASGKLEQLKAEAAESLGPPSPASAQAAHANRGRLTAQSPELRVLEEKVVQALRTVYDPEIPVNLYDLGLIYDIEIAPDNAVRILMTLTAPGCPVAESLPLEVEARVERVPEVKSAAVELVWDPAWNRDMLSEVARLELGM